MRYCTICYDERTDAIVQSLVFGPGRCSSLFATKPPVPPVRAIGGCLSLFFGTRKALVHHHVEPFAKACLGLPDRDAEANELVAPLALANARIELATGEKIDGRRLLGEHASSRLSSAAQR
jgi:hypothetical protein